MGRLSSVITAAVLGCSAALSLLSAGDAKRGEQLFNKACTGCHALDSEKEGPRLRGVFGRAAGAVPGFPYSEGIKKARPVWNEANLDQWLADPSTLVPNNDMAFRLDNPGQRADIIAYLKTLGPRSPEK